ncbi:MAG: heme exporter protein CcmB [Bacteroidota bacterium]
MSEKAFSALRSTAAVLKKDFASELRTRYAVNALIMFVVTTLSIILFAFGGENVSSEVLAGLLWIVIFFSAMSGLSRTFVSEEERGTTMTLQLLARPGSVYFGKLGFNVVLILSLSLLIVVLYFIFISNFVIRSYDIFVATLVLGGVGLASASTVIAAIIAKANTKGTLYPVLSFPILLPLLLAVIHSTKLSMEGMPFAEAISDLQLLLSYSVVVITASYLLFDFIWKD